jgi:hypothetical protein
VACSGRILFETHEASRRRRQIPNHVLLYGHVADSHILVVRGQIKRSSLFKCAFLRYLSLTVLGVEFYIPSRPCKLWVCPRTFVQDNRQVIFEIILLFLQHNGDLQICYEISLTANEWYRVTSTIFIFQRLAILLYTPCLNEFSNNP